MGFIWPYDTAGPPVASCFSLVFVEDAKDVGLVLQRLRVLQQLAQSVVVDGSAGVSGDAALCHSCHTGALEGSGERRSIEERVSEQRADGGDKNKTRGGRT